MNSGIPPHASDAAILSAALRFAVTALPPADWDDLEGIRILAGLPDPLAALVRSPHLTDAARLALHRFGIALDDEGYGREADAADQLGFRLAGRPSQVGSQSEPYSSAME